MKLYFILEPTEKKIGKKEKGKQIETRKKTYRCVLSCRSSGYSVGVGVVVIDTSCRTEFYGNMLRYTIGRVETNTELTNQKCQPELSGSMNP